MSEAIKIKNRVHYVITDYTKSIRDLVTLQHDSMGQYDSDIMLIDIQDLMIKYTEGYVGMCETCGTDQDTEIICEECKEVYY